MSQMNIVLNWVKIGLITREQSVVAFSRLISTEINPYKTVCEALSYGKSN